MNTRLPRALIMVAATVLTSFSVSISGMIGWVGLVIPHLTRMLLDEPVSNLDFGNQARVIAHIGNLVKTLRKTVVMTTHFPDHSFLPGCNVLLLYPDGSHREGKGRDIVTEQAIHNLYRIENRIVDIPEYEKRLCIPLE